MSTTMKKMSKFKTERGSRNDRIKMNQKYEQQLCDEKTLLGHIVERKYVSEEPLTEVICTTPSGFPSYEPSRAPTVMRNLSKFKNDNNNEQSRQQTYSEHDFENDNIMRVTNMTEEEVKSALDELSANFSKDSLEFLQRRGAGDLTPTTPSPRAKTVPVRSNKLDAGTKGSHVKPAMKPPPNSKKSPVEDSSDEIRFDLSGRRIIFTKRSANGDSESTAQSQFFANWVDILSKSILRHSLSKDDIKDIAKYCCETIFDSGFVTKLAVDEDFSTKVEDADTNILDEGIEVSPNTLGFSLGNVCKLISSEVRSQRLVGLRILNGVMSRRDLASTFEAYPAIPVVDLELAIPKPYDNTTITMLTFGNLCSFTLRKLCHQVTPPLSHFEHVIVETVCRVLTFAILKTCCAHDFPPEVAYLIKWNTAEMNSNFSYVYQLQSIKSAFCYMFSEVECNVGDMVLWSGGWGLRGAPVSVMTPLLRRPECSYSAHVKYCLEKQVAARSDIECNELYRLHLRQQENGLSDGGTSLPNQSGIAMRPHEEFALLSRWNRVDSMFIKESDCCPLADTMNRMLNDCLELVTRHCHESVNKQMSSVDDTNGESTAILVADILIWLLKLLSNSIRIADCSTISIIDEHIIRQNWPIMMNLFSLCVENGILFPEQNDFTSNLFSKSLIRICTCAWRVAAELSKRSKCFVEISCSSNTPALDVITRMVIAYFDGFYSSTNRNFHNSGTGFCEFDSSADCDEQMVLVWAIRFWRCCVSYHICLSVTLTLIRQVSENVDKLQKIFAPQVNVELMQLLEDTAMECSLYLHCRGESPTSSLVADDEITPNDLVHVEISCILMDLTATLLSRDVEWTEDKLFTISLTNNIGNLVSTVMGTADPTISKEKEPLHLFLTSHSRGPGLCSSIHHFFRERAKNILAAEQGCDKRPLSPILGKNKLENTYSGITSAVSQVRKAFLLHCQTHLFKQSSFCNYNNLQETVNGDIPQECHSYTMGIKSQQSLLTSLTQVFVLNRLALCYFSLMSPDNEAAFASLCHLVYQGDEWIQQHEWLNKDSVSCGLYSLQIHQMFQFITLTQIQLFAFVQNGLKVHVGEISSDFPVNMRYCVEHIASKGMTAILDHLFIICSLVPITTYDTLKAIVSHIIRNSLSKSELLSCQVECLLDIIIKAAYFSRPDEDFTLMTDKVNSQRDKSGFLYFDNVDRTSSAKSANQSLICDMNDHVQFSEVARLCSIDNHFFFTALASLKGLDLTCWLKALHHVVQAPKAQNGNDTMPSEIVSGCSLLEFTYKKCEKIAHRLYWLARLPVSTVDSFLKGGGRLENGIENYPLQFVQEDYVDMFRSCYSMLFEDMMWRVWYRNQKSTECVDIDTVFEVGALVEVVASTFNQSICKAQVALEGNHQESMEDESFTEKHIKNRIRSKALNITADNRISRGKSRGDGMEELFERLFAALVNQHVHTAVYATSVSVALIPGLIPWRLRENMWRTLGEMHLLHLMDSPIIQSSFILFLDVDLLLSNYKRRQGIESTANGTKRHFPISIIMAMADAINGMRMYSSEREMPIIHIGLFAVSYFIFGGNCSEISGARQLVFMKLLDHHSARREEMTGSDLVASSVLIDVLRFSFVLESTEDIVGDAFMRKLCEGGEFSADSAMEVLSSSILKLWKTVMKCPSSSDEICSVNSAIKNLPSWAYMNGELLPCLSCGIQLDRNSNNSSLSTHNATARLPVVLDVLKELFPELMERSNCDL